MSEGVAARRRVLHHRSKACRARARAVQVRPPSTVTAALSLTSVRWPIVTADNDAARRVGKCDREIPALGAGGPSALPPRSTIGPPLLRPQDPSRVVPITCCEPLHRDVGAAGSVRAFAGERRRQILLQATGVHVRPPLVVRKITKWPSTESLNATPRSASQNAIASKNAFSSVLVNCSVHVTPASSACRCARRCRCRCSARRRASIVTTSMSLKSSSAASAHRHLPPLDHAVGVRSAVPSATARPHHALAHGAHAAKLR